MPYHTVEAQIRMQFDQGLHCHFNHHGGQNLFTQVLDTILLHFSQNAKRK